MDPASERPTDFEELCSLEPRLRTLEQDVRAVRDDPGRPFFCSNYEWMPLNGRLRDLVGVARIPAGDRRGPGQALHDSRSYEVAFAHLSRLMPPCRGCGCLRFQPVRDAQT